MAVTELNKVKFVDQDFQSSVEAIKNFLQTNYPEEFTDYVNSNLGQALIDILAYATQNLMWNMNRKVTDLYFPTAVTPNSISKIARMLGYKPRGATGSIASLTVTLSNGPYTFPVKISKGFQFKGPNSLIFEYRGNTDVTWSPSELIKTFEVIEGETKISNFVSNGQTNQLFTLLNIPTGKYIEQGTVEVSVNGEMWTEFSFIPFEVTNAYETNLLSSPPFIKFGDGVQGSIPANGSVIEVKYIVVTGFKGRIVSTTIKQPKTPLTAQFNTIPISISQPASSAGGDDPEDLRSITVNAPKFQRTQDRAITKGDYDFLSNQFPNVAKGDAQIIRGVSADIYIQLAYEQITDLLNANSEISYSLSGFGLNQPLVDSVSGACLSISGILPNFTQMSSDIASVISAQTSIISTNTSQSMTQILSLSGDPGCSGVAATVSGYLNSISAANTTILQINNSVSGLPVVSGNVLSVSGSVSGILEDIEQIGINSANTSIALLASGYSQSISGIIDGLSGYIDEHMTDGCNANLVQVALLAKDANRSYVPPAGSTITSLKSYLEDRKDAVHTVSVISGTTRVLDADVLIELQLTDQANDDDVVTRVQDVIGKSDVAPLGILVEREFNKSLYLSEIYDAIDSVIEDFETTYRNVIIQNPSGYLDNRGNLIAPTGYVVQKGTITVKKLGK